MQRNTVEYWRQYARGWLCHFWGLDERAARAYREADTYRPADPACPHHLGYLAAQREDWCEPGAWRISLPSTPPPCYGRLAGAIWLIWWPPCPGADPPCEDPRWARILEALACSARNDATFQSPSFKIVVGRVFPGREIKITPLGFPQSSSCTPYSRSRRSM